MPPGFRANSFFVGLEKELRDLDKNLFDKKRRSMGTACVVLYGQPGGGKTHMARQYVFKNRKKFPGGIFWVSAGSKEELYHSFSLIKQRVIARDAPKLCEGANGADVAGPVKSWFESRQEWLIVLDGVYIDRDEDATDLSKFVPDSRNSSLIYVSRAKNLESKQRLLRPVPLKVGPLKEEQARKLLFKLLHIEKPNETEKTKASELVQQVGGLPMAIVAISHRMADTQEPLARFKLSYSNSPGIESTYNQIFNDLLRLEHMEAWNLINILCWYGQNIPVEMVRLGLRIFKRIGLEVRSRIEGGQPDINNTLSILIRYALIERNEPETDKDSTSSSRDSLVEPEPIDMLKIHSVVQSFCCDSLNSRQMLPQWLGYAISLFTTSYHQADIKIKSKTAAGRVSDYRCYLIHGQQLWDHIESYESQKQDLRELREILAPILDMIKDDIAKREPHSSQESLVNGVFQISIFDRTSSSSDSVPEAPAPLTPNYRPTPPPLDGQTIFGMPAEKPLDSPTSFGTASPGIRPKVVGYSPGNKPLEYEDPGYESDRETHQMQRNASELTERAPSRSRAPTTDSQTSGWETVPATRKTQKRPHRDLGSFRPTVARAELNRQSVSASIGVPTDVETRNRRDSSPAKDALKDVQNRSPTSSTGRIASFFQRNPFSRTNTENSKPSWANVAAGMKLSQQPPPNGGSERTGPSPAPLVLGESRSNRQGHSRRESHPSPLATEYVPQNEPDSSAQHMDGDFTLYSSDDQDAVTIPRTQVPPSPASYASAYQPSQAIYSLPYPSAQPHNAPPALGPNNTPLPIESNITVQPGRGTAYPYAPAYPSNLSQSLPSIDPRTYFPPSSRPIAGYTSQPMSRDTSHHSHASIAETEPPPYPTQYSPFTTTIPPPPSTVPLHQRAASDTRPLRTSPKTALMPSYPGESPEIDPTASMPGSVPMHSPTSTGRAPGNAIDTHDGSGLGIVGFSDTLQFGAQDPFKVQEAQRRAREQEERLRERRERASAPAVAAQGVGGNLGRPQPPTANSYPDINLIPTESDQAALGNMVEKEERRVSYPGRNLIPTQSDAGALEGMVETEAERGGQGEGNEYPPLPPAGTR